MSTALAEAARSAAVQPAAPTKNRAIDLIQANAESIRAALPSVITPERFMRAAMTAVRQVPGLADASRESFLGALLECAQLGLEPGPLGHASILPFNNRKKIDGQWVSVVEAQLIIEYRGFIDLGYRSGLLKSVALETVHQGDVWKSYTDESGKHLYHEALEEDTPVIAYYGVFLLATGGSVIQTLTPSRVESYRKRAQSQRTYNKATNKYEASEEPLGAWSSDYDSMALKTVVRRAENKLPKSPELARAFAVDEKPIYNFGGPAARAEDNVVDTTFTEIDAETGEIAPRVIEASGNDGTAGSEGSAAAPPSAQPTADIDDPACTAEQRNVVLGRLKLAGVHVVAEQNAFISYVIGRNVRGVTTLRVSEMNAVLDKLDDPEVIAALAAIPPEPAAPAGAPDEVEAPPWERDEPN